MKIKSLTTCAFLLILVRAYIAMGAEPARNETQANVMTEITFTAKAPHADPFNTLTLDVIFTDPQGKEFKVPAFWAGGEKWKVRYSTPEKGMHRYRTVCSDTKEGGLHTVAGEVEVGAYTGSNPLYLHGPIRVASDKRHFVQADGTPFFWLADTWWMGLCHRLHWPDEFERLAADRKAKGFNVIQIVAGLYPDMHPFDPRGANEAGYPWEEKYARIRPEYFDMADRRLMYLVDRGFSPCVVGAWGYFMPWMGVEKAKQHWRYLIARYGALPVTWCAAGEANLPWYLAKGFPYDDRKQVTDWTEVLRYIRATDPFHRPLTIHPTGIGRLSARHATNDAALLDFDMLQTPHGQRDAVAPTVSTMQQSYADQPTMPVINSEAAYEMLGDNLPTQWTRQMFWLCMTNGAAGHTYGANGIWQCNRDGEPHGPSPHHNGGVGYGKIPWNEAMNLPGSRQVGLGKKLFERFEWQKFVPHPEWAAYASEAADKGPAWGQWIWYPEGDPTKDAPVARRYFRKSFSVPDEKSNGVIWVSADDRLTLFINGALVREHAGTGTFEKIDITSKLRSGENVVAIMAENMPANVPANPAGLLVCMRLNSEAGNPRTIQSDGTWRASSKVANDEKWTATDFDDASWTSAKEVGEYGCAPWGQFGNVGSYGPYATGTPGKVRIIYVPMARDVRVAALEDGSTYSAVAFDPTTGESTELGEMSAAKAESHVVRRPAKIAGEDWVVVLESRE